MTLSFFIKKNGYACDVV